jgi:membrane fusion protein (multidrug efflux system)
MSKKAILIPIIILAIAAVLVFTISGKWTTWEGGGPEQRTDDAYLQADVTPLSTRVSGTVKKVDVQDYQPVTAGQVLIELDDADYQATVAQAEAALAGSHASYANNQAAKFIQDARVQNAETTIQQAAATVAAAKASISSVEPQLTRATLEEKRQAALLEVKASTPQQNEQATADAARFSGMLASSQADLQRAQAVYASSQVALEAEKRQRSALNTQDASYLADIKAKQDAIVVAKVNLGYTRITAPVNGSVGQRHVQVGQLVTAGQQTIDLVPGDPWVQANFKETQLTHMRTGDVADIRVDTFPGTVLHGKVVQISPASGSQFALLPPDNATGNFTKVVQRIPVKIVLDPGHPLQGLLRPGFSVEVTVHTSGSRSGEQAQ